MKLKNESVNRIVFVVSLSYDHYPDEQSHKERLTFFSFVSKGGMSIAYSKRCYNKRSKESYIT